MRRKPVHVRARRPDEQDDTARLQEAIDKAARRRWGRVVVAPKDYIVSRLTIPPDFELR